MAELSNEVQTFVVIALAQYMDPSEVVAAVKEEFGSDVNITRQQVRHYNPEQSPDLAPKWRELHAAERTKFLEHIESIPLANQAVRVRELEDLYRKAKRSGNLVLAADLAKQIAQEIGGAFTNRREMTGAAGGPMQIEVTAEATDYRNAAAALKPPD